MKWSRKYFDMKWLYFVYMREFKIMPEKSILLNEDLANDKLQFYFIWWVAHCGKRRVMILRHLIEILGPTDAGQTFCHARVVATFRVNRRNDQLLLLLLRRGDPEFRIVRFGRCRVRHTGNDERIFLFEASHKRFAGRVLKSLRKFILET